MICILLIIVPLILGAVSFFIRGDITRRCLIAVTSAAHLLLTALVWIKRPGIIFNGWFGFDSLSIIFLSITSVLFCGASFYGIKYLAHESRYQAERSDGRNFFTPEAVFSGCFLLFLSTMTIVICTRHLGMLWAAIEATTLTSAPLIYFHRTKRSLEATWKYLLICSVGIALALLGIFFIAAANSRYPGDMTMGFMLQHAAQMDIPWLKAAFLLLFVGYGTKVGLAPFHTWLPDAHSEAPSVVSALLSGALLNCAFLGILRGFQLCSAAGLAPYCREIFLLFGLVSVIFAAVFILGQSDYKRMLAYSSVEHMGILAIGLGFGGSAVFGALFNAVGHSLAKAGLFLTAGNILSYYKTKIIKDVRGIILGSMRMTGILWIAGFLLITGTPPSGIFIGKFVILKEGISGGHYWAAFIFLAALAIVFIGMARIFISMTQGEGEQKTGNDEKDAGSFWTIFPPLVLFVIVIVIGIYCPSWLSEILRSASGELGGM